MDAPSIPFRMLIDFDGTLVDPNVAILLVEEFCDGGKVLAHAVDEELHAGKITLRQAWARQVALLPPDRVGEMAGWAVRHAPLRAGAHELLSLLSAHSVPTWVVSGGLDFYIHPILRNAGIDLPVLSDSIERTADGRLQVVHPHGHPTCLLCGICKAQAVRTLSPPAERTIFAGDGGTDRYAAEVADIVFARRRLRDYCERKGIPYLPFDGFGPVTDQLRRWFQEGHPVPGPRRLGMQGSPCPISQSLANAVS